MEIYRIIVYNTNEMYFLTANIEACRRYRSFWAMRRDRFCGIMRYMQWLRKE